MSHLKIVYVTLNCANVSVSVKKMMGVLARTPNFLMQDTWK